MTGMSTGTEPSAAPGLNAPNGPSSPYRSNAPTGPSAPNGPNTAAEPSVAPEPGAPTTPPGPLPRTTPLPEPLRTAAALLPEYAVAEAPPLLASSLAELEALNAAAPEGALLRVGLRLVPEGFERTESGGFRPGELGGLSRPVRRLRNLTVRGCWVEADLTGVHGAALGRYFRACYESAKTMSAVLPCAMPWLCAAGALEGLARNQIGHPETLDEALRAARIVAAQNTSAFYAKLWMS